MTTASGSSGGADAELLSLDEVFEILASERRRYVLYELRGERIAQLDDLARRVAAREADVCPDAVDETRTERVAIGLHHHDLPRLEQARLVDYDTRRGDVYTDEYFDIVEKYIDIAREDEVVVS